MGPWWAPLCRGTQSQPSVAACGAQSQPASREPTHPRVPTLLSPENVLLCLCPQAACLSGESDGWWQVGHRGAVRPAPWGPHVLSLPLLLCLALGLPCVWCLAPFLRADLGSSGTGWRLAPCGPAAGGGGCCTRRPPLSLQPPWLQGRVCIFSQCQPSLLCPEPSQDVREVFWDHP